ncbi:LnmK family bifunctional acyltransferase/decarboxylase [Phenylobacterium sp.]|uniref:LnmK family bifunctional acyltransferase/decarboxylase n=1 Tax=Phenylobacterium sp. TaxID=1871053 RepID=UPI00374D5823
MTRVIYRDEYNSLELRRYFERTAGLKVGLYTLGAFDRWRLPPNTVVGRYSSIAKSARLIDANHPIDALSTHPYFYLKEFGLSATDRANVQAQVVEDDVWLGHNCTVTPGCHVIGRGSIVGAGAVVMSDVPRYAIMAGAPAKLVRYRFAPDVIEAVEATEWWLLDKPDLEAALRQAPGFAFAPTRENANQFLAAIGKPALPPYAAPSRAVGASAVAGGVAVSESALTDLLRRDVPDFTSGDLTRPLTDLKIDSFGLINLRIGIETLIGRQITDRDWGSVMTLSDVVALAQGQAPVTTAAAPAMAAMAPEVDGADVSRPTAERRIQYVNMPQMALSGLSELWTFKELGDMHWSVLTRGLRTPSAAVADSEGDRLYATFTRICLSSDQPLTDIKENDRLTMDLEMTRFGAGMFFSSASIATANGAIQASIMTSFSKFGEAGANTSLLKGQPVIPEGCEIAPLTSLPKFAQDYRTQRASDLPAPLFEFEYAILPPHDINGVGLLYFAAYPQIFDLCAMQRFGRSMFSDFSTTYRDVYYFANCGPDDTPIFRIHRCEEGPSAIEFDASLVRKSDGKLMAFTTTVKRRIHNEVRAAGSLKTVSKAPTTVGLRV